MTITLAFLLLGALSGGAGAEGCAESSCIRMCVMYDSESCPFWSCFEKHESIILLFSSSKRSARDICAGFVPDVVGRLEVPGLEEPLLMLRWVGFGGGRDIDAVAVPPLERKWIAGSYESGWRGRCCCAMVLLFEVMTSSS